MLKKLLEDAIKDIEKAEGTDSQTVRHYHLLNAKTVLESLLKRLEEGYTFQGPISGEFHLFEISLDEAAQQAFHRAGWKLGQVLDEHYRILGAVKLGSRVCPLVLAPWGIFIHSQGGIEL